MVSRACLFSFHEPPRLLVYFGNHLKTERNDIKLSTHVREGEYIDSSCIIFLLFLFLIVVVVVLLPRDLLFCIYIIPINKCLCRRRCYSMYCPGSTVEGPLHTVFDTGVRRKINCVNINQVGINN